MSKDVLNEKNASLILRTLYDLKEPTFLSNLQDVVRNYHVLKNTVSKLIEVGFVAGEEVKVKGRTALKISLTPKGQVVAEQLKRAEWMAKLSPEELERFKNMRALIHLNVYEDHVSIIDIHMGQKRIANIYARPKGDEIYFWCDIHEDTDCYHIMYMFADPELSDFIRSWVEKNGFKLASIYEKYMKEYW